MRNKTMIKPFLSLDFIVFVLIMFFIMTKKNIFEFDGMPIDISETDFLKKLSMQ